MKKQSKNLLKIWILVFVLVFETAFMGYVPVNAASVSDNTVNSESNMSVDMTITEEPSENEKETEPFTGASGKSDDLTWNISPEGVLTVEGTGNYKKNYYSEYYSFCPEWSTYRDHIKTAEIHVTGITDMSYMFNKCYSLTSVDFNDTDMSNVTDMNHMFSGCNALTTIDWNKFSTSNVTDMSYMFSSCYSLQSLDLSKFDTSKVTDMNSMFNACKKVVNLDLSNFNTTNVTDMYKMFSECYSLQELDISSFNTGNVTSMSWMFAHTGLKELDLKHFSTSKVNGRGFSNMFYGSDELLELDISSFDTSSVTDLGWMFADTGLTELDLKHFDTSNVTDMEHMFYSCNNLVKLDVSSFDTGKVTDMEDMFSNCYKLKELDISNFDTSKYAEGAVFDLGSLTHLERFVSGKEKRTYKVYSTADYWIDDYGNRYPDNTEIELAPNTILYRLFNTYKINYIYEGDLSNAKDKYTLDQTLEITASVNKDHYTFDGWYTDAKYTKKITKITAGTYGDITLYAKMIPNTYSITYKNVEDILNTEQLTTAYVYGIEMIPVVPTKNCFIFDGWYLDEDLTKVFTGISSTTSGDLELYAKWKENHDLDKENGVVIKEATTISEGEIRYQCKHCSYTETEKIPRIVTQESQITDETILNKSDDSDMEGSDFTKFQARASKTTKNSICLKWNKIKDADGYKIYGNKCGKKNQYEFIKTVKGANKTTWTHKKRKKGTYYKYIVRAYKIVDGQEITLSVSKTIHATTTGGKKGNAKSLKIKTDKKCKKTKSGYTLTLKKGKKYTFKASEVAAKKKIDIHRRVRFESTNKKIATVSSKGVVKTKNPGTCYIYAYAQNGVYKKIKVVVK